MQYQRGFAQRRPVGSGPPGPPEPSDVEGSAVVPGSGQSAEQLVDGPTLRAIREGLQLPLRRVARHARLSHGHLSKVERGEFGRPITPTVIAAYEKATGVSVREALAQGETGGGGVRRRGHEWRPGDITGLRRMSYNAQLGSLTMGGQLGEPLGRMVDRAGHAALGVPPGQGDLAQLELLVQHLSDLDARFGGRVVAPVAKTQLKLLLPLMEPSAHVLQDWGTRACRLFGMLAGRAAWAAFDSGGHECARTLFPVALWCAMRGDDPDLRAHVAADAAAQYVYLGYPQDALRVLPLVEADDRVASPVRMVVHGVKARAYAAAGDASRCRRQVIRVEQAFADADDAPASAEGWVGTLRTAPRVEAATGHALAVLGRHTGHGEDLEQARQRLTRAVEGFDPVRQARARVLCQAQLAGLLAHLGEHDQAAGWAAQARHDAEGMGSARVAAALHQLRETVPHDDDSAHDAGEASQADPAAAPPSAAGVPPAP